MWTSFPLYPRIRAPFRVCHVLGSLQPLTLMNVALMTSPSRAAPRRVGGPLAGGPRASLSLYAAEDRGELRRGPCLVADCLHVSNALGPGPARRS
jgi:hypothetical protein